MKKKADPTTPVACRIDNYTYAQLLKSAADMEMSMSQYIAFLLTITLYGTDAHHLQERLIELTQQLEALQSKLKEEACQTWKKEPYVSFLKKVLHNDIVLEDLYNIHNSKPIPIHLMREMNYNAGIFLTGISLEDKVYQYTERYGWAYIDRSKTLVTIIKRN